MPQLCRSIVCMSCVLLRACSGLELCSPFACCPVLVPPFRIGGGGHAPTHECKRDARRHAGTQARGHAFAAMFVHTVASGCPPRASYGRPVGSFVWVAERVLSSVHDAPLRVFCGGLRQHCHGLAIAARLARHAGLLRSPLAKRLVPLGVAVACAQHASGQGAGDLPNRVSESLAVVRLRAPDTFASPCSRPAVQFPLAASPRPPRLSMGRAACRPPTAASPWSVHPFPGTLWSFFLCHRTLGRCQAHCIMRHRPCVCLRVQAWARLGRALHWPCRLWRVRSPMSFALSPSVSSRRCGRSTAMGLTAYGAKHVPMPGIAAPTPAVGQGAIDQPAVRFKRSDCLTVCPPRHYPIAQGVRPTAADCELRRFARRGRTPAHDTARVFLDGRIYVPARMRDARRPKSGWSCAPGQYLDDYGCDPHPHQC